MTTTILFPDTNGAFYETGIIKDILAASNLVKRLGDQVTSITISISETELTKRRNDVTVGSICEVFLNKVKPDDIIVDYEDNIVEFDMATPNVELSGDEINQIHVLADFIKANFIKVAWIEIYLFLAPLHSQGNE